ncbi:MAG: DUF6502 family protein [Granulosicoccus sp.]
MPAKHSILLSALSKLTRPLVQILLRHGVACDDFVDVIRHNYVAVADKDFTPEGRKQSLSNIALITGIHRHEVKKLMESASQDLKQATQHHRAARVINGWLTDPEFSTDGVANPLVIATEFKRLVGKYSGDITPRPIQDELLRVGAIEKPTKDKVRLLLPAYVPHNSDEDLIHIFGDSVADLISTLEHNLKSEPEARRLQLSVVHNNFPDEVLSDLELVCREKSLEFLQNVNQFFETQDRDSNPNVHGTGRNRAGVGLYFFKEKMDEN